MWLIDKIKAWFRREKEPEGTQKALTPEPTSTPPTEVEVLVQEHDHLEAERGRLKKEIQVIDARYSDGAIEAAERDRAYRTRLARAGSISIRQIEIRSQLLQMGHPIMQRTTSAAMAY